MERGNDHEGDSLLGNGHKKLIDSVLAASKEDSSPFIRYKVSLLALIPLSLFVIIVLRGIVNDLFNPTHGPQSFAGRPFSDIEGFDGGPDAYDSECVTCLANKTYCTLKSAPVLGGVDLVATYNSFNSSSRYQQVATGGTSDHTATYAGYLFHFSNSANKAIFEENPTKYLPQWGGFCAWGISGEYCPNYAWSADCLGPAGNWYAWNIFQDKLYFFLMPIPLDFFYENVDKYIDDGNKRWNEWFGDEIVLSTNCYVQKQPPTSRVNH